MADFVMPQLGSDMKSGRLLAWHVKPGDHVKRGDIIAEVETEKANIEVEVFATGVVDRLLVQPHEKVPVGTLMAIIRSDGGAEAAEQLSAIAKGPQPEAAPAPLVAPAPQAVETVLPAPAVAAGLPRLRISPLARKIAEQLAVDVTAIRGTGPCGAITREDVERAGQTPATPVVTAAERAAMMRQTIAAAMARSKREIPHYYLGTTVDLGRAEDWLREENLKRPVTDRLLTSVLFLKAVALALREMPEFNATWQDGAAVQSEQINLGVAISLRAGGLVAPCIREADRMNLDELMRAFLDLVKRTRAGSLRSSEISDPTITVTSLGDQGVEEVIGIIYPPQVALVGFGKVVERPWCVDGQVVPRPVVRVTLSADHRATDGHRGGLFLAAIERLLQEPEKL